MTMKRVLCICLAALFITVTTFATRVTAYIYPEANFVMAERGSDQQIGISPGTMMPLASTAILYLAISTAVYSINGSIPYQRDMAYAQLGIHINAFEFEFEVFRLTNIERVRHGLPLLIWDDNLADIARAHSRDLAWSGIFDHIGSDGTNGGQRLVRAGITYRLWAENLSGGIKMPAEAVDAWMNSPEHRVNILNPELTHLGVGFYHNTNSDWFYYAAQKFVLYRTVADR